MLPSNFAGSERFSGLQASTPTASSRKRTIAESDTSNAPDQEVPSTTEGQQYKRRHLQLDISGIPSGLNRANGNDATASSDDELVMDEVIKGIQTDFDYLAARYEEVAEVKKRIEAAQAQEDETQKYKRQYLEAQKEIEDLRSIMRTVKRTLQENSKALADPNRESQKVWAERNILGKMFVRVTEAARDVTAECGWITEESCGRLGKKMDALRKTLSEHGIPTESE